MRRATTMQLQQQQQGKARKEKAEEK